MTSISLGDSRAGGWPRGGSRWRTGATTRVLFAVQPPDRPGTYRFRLPLVQKGGAWFDERGGPALETTVEVSP